MNPQCIDQFEAGADKLRHAVAGLSPQDLQAHPGPGLWSILQVVMHLMDSDLIWTARIKQIIAEDKPTIVSFDETRVAALPYSVESLEPAITIFELNRRLTARMLRALPPSAFDRVGRHNQRGDIQAGASLQMLVEHLDHHLAFIYEKRARLGKPQK